MVSCNVFLISFQSRIMWWSATCQYFDWRRVVVHWATMSPGGLQDSLQAAVSQHECKQKWSRCGLLTWTLTSVPHLSVFLQRIVCRNDRVWRFTWNSSPFSWTCMYLKASPRVRVVSFLALQVKWYVWTSNVGLQCCRAVTFVLWSRPVECGAILLYILHPDLPGSVRIMRGHTCRC